MKIHGDQRVDLFDRVSSALCLRATDIALTVNNLALQVGLIDNVEFNNAQGAHTCCCQVHQRWRAQPTGANTQHLGILQTLLTGHADIRNDQVAAIAAHFVDAQFDIGIHEGRQAHDDSMGSGYSG